MPKTFKTGSYYRLLQRMELNNWWTVYDWDHTGLHVPVGTIAYCIGSKFTFRGLLDRRASARHTELIIPDPNHPPGTRTYLLWRWLADYLVDPTVWEEITSPLELMALIGTHLDYETPWDDTTI